MGKLKNSLLIFSLIMVGMFSFLSGCNNNVYKNLKLQLVGEETFVLNSEEKNNLFTIDAIVTGAPKGYDGSVTCDLPTNSSVAFVESKVKSAGKTTFTFLAKKPGRVDISFLTTEGNIKQIKSIQIMRKIESISFNRTIIPFIKNEEVDISRFLEFYPIDTTQSDFVVEVFVNDSKDNCPILVSGSRVTVPQDCDIKDFKIKVISKENETIFAEVDAKVVEVLSDDKIKLMSNDVEVAKNENGEYVVNLAYNTTDLNSCIVNFNFDDNPLENDNYIVEVENLDSEGYIHKNDGSENKVLQVGKLLDPKQFKIDTICEGNFKVVFKIKRVGYEDYAPFIKTYILNVISEAYPNAIKVYDQNDNEVNKLTIFSNYTQIDGTPFKINVLNGLEKMIGEPVLFTIENNMTANNFDTNIKIVNNNSSIVEYNTPYMLLENSVFYLAHTYDVSPIEIFLVVTSAKNPKIQCKVELEIVTESLNLTFAGKTEEYINLDINNEEPKTIMFDNYNYNYSTLVFSQNYDKYITLELETRAFKIKHKNIRGNIDLKVTAQNGSFVLFHIIISDVINSDNSAILIAGKTITNDKSNLQTVKVASDTELPIQFKINNVTYLQIPDWVGCDIKISTKAEPDIYDTSIVRLSSSGTKLIAQKKAGISTIKIVLGLLGEQDETKLTEFVFDIEVVIPVYKLDVNAKECKIFNNKQLTESEKHLGKHKILLNVQPSNAKIKESEVFWYVRVGNNELHEFVKNGDTNQLIYHDINTSSNIYLNPGNSFLEKIVQCDFGQNRDLVFYIVAQVKQPGKEQQDNYIIDQNGNERQFFAETEVKVFAKKVVKVTDMIFADLPYEKINNQKYFYIDFDERKIQKKIVDGIENDEFDETSETTYKRFKFNVMPFNALNKNLVADSFNPLIKASINNVTNELIVQLRSSNIEGKNKIFVYPEDNVNKSLRIEIEINLLKGTKQNPFKINNIQDLKDINKNLNAHYVLNNDIIVNEWIPIGFDQTTNITKPFTGSFVGSRTFETDYGKKILQYSLHNMIINCNPNMPYYGLFAVLGETAEVSNVILDKFFIDVKGLSQEVTDENLVSKNIYIGALAGVSFGKISNIFISDKSEINNCNSKKFNQITNDSIIDKGILASFKGTDKPLNYYIGGAVGFNQKYNNGQGIIENVKINMQINVTPRSTMSTYVGGVVGFNNGQVINKKVNNGMNNSTDVTVAINNYIVKQNGMGNSNDSNSAFGGVAGYNNYEISNLNVQSLIFSGFDFDKNVNAKLNNVGGLVGFNNGKVTNNIVNPYIKGNKNIGGLIGIHKYQDTNVYATKPNKDIIGKIDEINGKLSDQLNCNDEYLKTLKLTFENNFYKNVDDISGNKIEFIDRQDSDKFFNTPIIGNNNVGGLIGTYVNSLMIGTNNASIQYNSIYSYYVNKIFTNYDINIEDNDNNHYYGDILAIKNPNSDVITNVGGLIGKTGENKDAFDTKPFYTELKNNYVSINIQGQGHNIGGLIGEQYEIININNCAVNGNILDTIIQDESSTDLNKHGGFIGKFDEGNSNDNKFVTSYSNIKFNNALLNKFIGNDIAVSSDTSILGYNGNDKKFSDDLVYYLITDNNGDGIDDNNLNVGITNIWFSSQEINNGVPLLLSKNKVKIVNNKKYIDLLTNIPPTEIRVELKENFVNSFIIGLPDNLEITLNKFEISETNYLPNGKIDFGRELIKSEYEFLVNKLNKELNALNTYNLSGEYGILNAVSIPSFVGINNVITSSNEYIAQIIQNVNGEMVLYANNIGQCDIIIASQYNREIKKSIRVNIVNPINHLESFYYKNGNKFVLDLENDVDIYKSTQSNPYTLMINNNIAYNFEFDENSGYSKIFELNTNLNSGIRYYFMEKVGNTYSFINGTTNLTSPLKISNEEIKMQNVGLNKNIYYIDIPMNKTADFQCDQVIASQYLLAIPYFDIVQKDNSTFRKLLFELDFNTNESLNFVDKNIVLNNVKVPNNNYFARFNNMQNIEDESKKPTAVEIKKANDNAYINYLSQMIKFINISVKNASYDITANKSKFDFDPQTKQELIVEIVTEEIDCNLYIKYFDYAINGNKVVKFNRNSINNKTNIVYIDDLKLELKTVQTFGFNNLPNPTAQQILAANDAFGKGAKFIRFNFIIEVEENNKININNDYINTLEFFIIDDKFNVSDSEIGINPELYISKSYNVELNLHPQKINSLHIKHYPHGENHNGVITPEDDDKNPNNEEKNKFLEESYLNIIPGVSGLLKINISPYYAAFDKIELLSSKVGDSNIWFNQLYLKTTTSKDGIIDKSYIESNSNVALDGKIELEKYSNIYENLVKDYDGNLYIGTLINSFVPEGSKFDITVNIYKNKSLLITKTISLDVITLPKLELNVNGGKYAPIAVGTAIQFDANLMGVSDNSIDFSASVIKYKGQDSEQQINTIYKMDGFDNKYNFILKRDLVGTNGYSGHIIEIIGKVKKLINGIEYVSSDKIELLTTNFVIDSLDVSQVDELGFNGLFGQSYLLNIIVNAKYDYKNPKIKEEVELFQKNINKSIYDKTDDIKNIVQDRWFEVDGDTYKSIPYNDTNADFVLTSKNDKFYIKGLKFDTKSKILAQVKYYFNRDNGEIALITPETDTHTLGKYVFEVTKEFGFNFYRYRDEKMPEPIHNVEEFKAMQDGVDYMLVNDLVLDNWQPLSKSMNFNSLDGNGYVITINSFKLDELPDDYYRNPNVELLLGHKNIGIFEQINDGTIIKNLIIEVKPNRNYGIENELASIEDKTTHSSKYNEYGDLIVNAKAYKEVSFGLLAGVNAGTLTNIQITNDASKLKLYRELKLQAEDFDLAKFQNKYCPEYTINEEYDKDGLVDYRFKLKQQSSYIRRDLSVVKIETTIATTEQNHYMGLLVGENKSINSKGVGYITNSSIDNITINGIGYVAGVVANNEGKISTTYFKGGNVINRSGESSSTNNATGGFAVFNNGTNANIQFSYVEGRLGSGENFELVDSEHPIITSPTNADKTGIDKSINIDNTNTESYFASLQYINKKMINGKRNPEYKSEVASVRALNSAIYSTTDASGFIYKNNGFIENSYSNILVAGTKSTSGFVFENDTNGKINACLSLSSVLVNNTSASPFTGRNSNFEYNIKTPNSITNCHYFKLGGGQIGDSPLEKANSDKFDDANEVATAIGTSQLYEYNTFQAYAFNTDYAMNQFEEISRAVWFIPNGGEKFNGTIGDDGEYKLFYKAQTLTNSPYYRDYSTDNIKDYKEHYYYTLNRPQLVAANLVTSSIRKIQFISGSNGASDKYKYDYVSNTLGEDFSNPILVKSAEEFNDYLLPEYSNDGNNGIEQKNSLKIRFASDIAFNNRDLKANTYKIDYSGDFDGNGMEIGNIRLIADMSSEDASDQTQGDKVTHLGLFGKILTREIGGKIEKGVVRNINLSVDEIRGSKVNYVGALAGEIQNANVFNVNVNGAETIQGNHVVGGVVGYVSGVSEIVNIKSSLSANALHYQPGNIYSYNNRYEPTNPFSIVMFDKVNGQQEKIPEYEKIVNINNISYAGGVAGIINVCEDKSNSSLDKQFTKATIYNAKARSLTAFGNINLLGEIVGGVVGGLGKDSLCSDTKFIVEKDCSPHLMATRIAGGIIGDNRGRLDRSYIAHDYQTQVNIDNSYKKATEINQNIYRVINMGYNDLFSSLNPHFIGGIVGFNNGGTIQDSYSKINVLNLDSQYAGGIVGLIIGGTIKSVYTTGSVTACENVGGIIGNYHAISESNINDLNKFIKLPATVDYDKIFNFKEIDLSNIVAANVWREEDLITDRQISIDMPDARLNIGTLIGTSILSGDGAIIIKEKDSIYFVQPVLNKPLGTLPEIVGANKVKGLMNEIGTSKNEVITYKPETIDDNDPDLLITSRMQTYGSSRTHKEIINIHVIKSEAMAVGSQFKIAHSPSELNVTKSSSIYNGWSTEFWVGARKTAEENADTADVNTVYPYLQPKPVRTFVRVYKEKDLEALSSSPEGEFIIMQDIEITKWNTLKEFKGNLHSNKVGGKYENHTLYFGTKNTTGQDIKYSPITRHGQYLGFIGEAKNAYLHHFNIEYMNLSSNAGEAYYVGALFAKGSAVVDGVNIINSNINATNALSVGGIAGYANQSHFQSCKVENVTININGEINIGEIQTLDVDTNQLSDIYLGYGGIVGTFSSNNELKNAGLHHNSVVKTTINIDRFADNTKNASLRNIGIGGIMGIAIQGTTTNCSDLKTEGVNLDIDFTGTQKTDLNVGGLFGDSGTINIISDNSKDRKDNEKLVDYYLSVAKNDVGEPKGEIIVKISGTHHNNIGGIAGILKGVISKSELEAVKNINCSVPVTISKIESDSNIGGLFGSLKSIKVSNLKSNAQISIGEGNLTPPLNYGGITGKIESASIENAYVDGKIDIKTAAGNLNIGGIVGTTSGASNNGRIYRAISNYSKFEINNNNINSIGGIIGHDQNIAVEECANYSDIKITTNKTNVNIGGLIGSMKNTNTDVNNSLIIKNNYSVGNIGINQLDNNLGLLIGNILDHSNNIKILNNYTIGIFKLSNLKNIYNSKIKGGILGKIANNVIPKIQIAYNYYNLDFVPYSNNIGIGLTTSEMLFNSNKFNNYDNSIWTIANNSYPKLNWIDTSEHKILQSSGSLVCPNNGYSQSAQSMITTNSSYNNATIENKVVYFKDASINSAITQIKNSLVYGLNKNSAISIDENSIISNFNINAKITNSGILSNGKSNTLNAIKTNNGVIDLLNLTTTEAVSATAVNPKPTGVLKNSVIQNSAATTMSANILNIIGSAQNSYVKIKNQIQYYNENSTLTTVTQNNTGADKDSKPLLDLSNFTNKIYNYNGLQDLDFNDVWVVITPNDNGTNKDKLNYGFPMLQWELKNHWSDKNLKPDYYWVPQNLTEDKNIVNTIIATVEDLAKVSAQSNGFNSKIETTLEFGNNGISQKIIENNLVITTYNYGIKTVETKTINNGINTHLTFKNEQTNGATSIIDTLDLGGKLWTPIGNVTNPFSGTISGDNFIIKNVSVVENNREVGLFGVVNHSINNFAKGIILKNGVFINSTNNAIVGSLIGKLNLNKTDQTVISKVANEKGFVVSGKVASGLIGKINANTNIKSTIEKSFTTADIYGAETHGLTSLNNISLNLSEYYYATNKSQFDGTALTNMFNGNVADTFEAVYYQENSIVSTSAEAISSDELKIKTIAGFDWSSTWERTKEADLTLRNYGYPILARTNGDYWINHTEAVTNASNTFTITKPEQLAWVSKQVLEGNNFSGKSINITKDLDFEKYIWTPIGTETTPFKGTIKANSNIKLKNINTRGFIPTNSENQTQINKHILKLLLQNSNNANSTQANNNVGLLGNVENATIQNINIVNGIFVGKNYVAGIVGKAKNTTITACTVDNNTKIYGAGCVGGIIGKYIHSSTSSREIKANSNNSSINYENIGTDKNNFGGIIGNLSLQTTGGDFKLSENKNVDATIDSNIDSVGGIVGNIYGTTNSTITIFNNINKSTIVGQNAVGGIVGNIDGTINSTIAITNNVNNSTITGKNAVGGIVGKTSGDNVTISGQKLRVDNDKGLTGNDSEGEITANGNGGGIVGEINNQNTIVQFVTNNAKVNGTQNNSQANIGGIVGNSNSTHISEVKNLGDINAKSGTGGGIVGKIAGNYLLYNLYNKGTITGTTNSSFIGNNSKPDITTGMFMITNSEYAGFKDVSTLVSSGGLTAFETGDQNVAEIISYNPYWNDSSELDYKSMLQPTNIEKPELIIEPSNKYYKVVNNDQYKWLIWENKIHYVPMNSTITPFGDDITKIQFSNDIEIYTSDALTNSACYPFRANLEGELNNDLNPLSVISIGYALGTSGKKIEIKNLNTNSLLEQGNYLAISNINSTQPSANGGIANKLYNSTVAKCNNAAKKINNIKNITHGGLVNIAKNCIFTQCTNTEQVGSGTGSTVGGIVGTLDGGSIENSSNSSKIEGGGNVGGIVGTLVNSAKIDTCNNGVNTDANGKEDKSTHINGTSIDAKVGGIAGDASGGTITNCTNYGAVTYKNYWMYEPDSYRPKTGSVYSNGGVKIPAETGKNLNVDCKNTTTVGNVTSIDYGAIAGVKPNQASNNKNNKDEILIYFQQYCAYNYGRDWGDKVSHGAWYIERHNVVSNDVDYFKNNNFNHKNNENKLYGGATFQSHELKSSSGRYYTRVIGVYYPVWIQYSPPTIYNNRAYNVTTYTITFMDDSTEISKVTIVKDDVYDYDGFVIPNSSNKVFAGWFTGKTDGSQISGSQKITKNVVVYAHWKDNEYVVAIKYKDKVMKEVIIKNYAELENSAQIEGYTYYYLYYTTKEEYNKIYTDNKFKDYRKTYDDAVSDGYLTEIPRGKKGADYLPVDDAYEYYGKVNPNNIYFNLTVNKTYDEALNDHTITKIPDGKSKQDFLTIEELKAHYAIENEVYCEMSLVTYNINYENTQNVNNPNPTTYNVEMQTITLQDISRDGYTFLGWFDSVNGGQKVASIPKGSAGHKTLYARWEVESYTITYNNVKGDNPNPTTYNVELQTITLQDLSQQGYTFLGWFDSASGGQKVTTIPKGSVGHKTLYAQWEVNKYKLKFNALGGSSTQNSRQVVFDKAYNSEGELPQANKTGYQFVGWFTSAQDGTPITGDELMPANDVEVFAHYIANTYQVIFNGNGNTNVVTMPNQTLTYDQTENLANNLYEKSGYKFLGWSKEQKGTVDYPNLKSVTNLTSENNGSVILYAQWKIENYTITYNNVKGENLNPTTYNIKTQTIVLQDLSEPGYKFLGWFDSETGGQKVTTIEKGSTGHKILYAQWEPITN